MPRELLALGLVDMSKARFDVHHLFSPFLICLNYLHILIIPPSAVSVNIVLTDMLPKNTESPQYRSSAGFFFAVILAKAALIGVLACRTDKYTFRNIKTRENAAIGNPWARLRPTTCTRSVWSAPCRARSPLSCRPGVRHATPGLVLVSSRYLWGDRSPHANSCR